MLQNSSEKKNSITSSAEYDQLYQLYSEAWDRLQSGGTGAGYSGIHEYEAEYLGTKDKSDEEYLSQFNDIE